MIMIRNEAFYGCTALEEVHFGGVSSIGSRAFGMNSSLKGIVIPATVSEIGSNAFIDCDYLTIYAEAPEKPPHWSATWNSSNRPVIWDAVVSIIQANELMRGLLPKADAERIYLTKESAAQKYMPTELAHREFITQDMAKAVFLTFSEAENTYAKKTYVSRVYRYQGTVQNYSDLPQYADFGDVYNVVKQHVTSDGDVYPPGTNYAWDGRGWDPLSGYINPVYAHYLNFKLNSSPVIVNSDELSGLQFETTVYNNNLTPFTQSQIIDGLSGLRNASPLNVMPWCGEVNVNGVVHRILAIRRATNKTNISIFCVSYNSPSQGIKRYALQVADLKFTDTVTDYNQ